MGDVERIEIRPAVWKLALAFVGAAVFALLGLATAVFAESIAVKAAGILGVAFFGGFGAWALYGWVRGDHQRVAVSRVGLEVYLPGVGWRVVPWSDIERIDALEFSGQGFTTVRLRDYDALLAGLTPEQSRAAARRLVALGLFGQATAGLLGMPWLGRFLRGSEAAADLPGVLAFNRARFGADLLFGWAERDRGARDFAEFLRRWRDAPARRAPRHGG